MAAKRARSPSGDALSPPPLKRKVESTTTSRAVASFFKPASQKKPDQITWRIVNKSLIIAKYIPEDQKPLPDVTLRRIAAFDLDDTLIKPGVGEKWARSATSWQWWNVCVPTKLKDLHKEGYQIIIISNQSTISLKDNAKSLQKDSASLQNFKNQVTAVLRQLDLPISVFAATEHDQYRKPRTGMWQEMLEDYDLESPGQCVMERSFYIGDAAGREKTVKRPKDHACSDRDLAANIGITFKTPEEFFLGEAPESFRRAFEPTEYLKQTTTTSAAANFEKTNKLDVVMFCGSPGAGKSTFFATQLQPLGYERVNQDTLKTRERCVKATLELLRSGHSVAIDNTCPDPETRAVWIQIARSENVPIRCVHFTVSSRLCEHNSAVRAFNPVLNPEKRIILPGIAFSSFANRYRKPELSEGFQDIFEVDFKFQGTPEQQKIWSKYWVSKYST